MYVYATPLCQDGFQKELSTSKQARGSVQFSLNEPKSWDLIKRIVKFRVKQQDEPVSGCLAGLSAPGRNALQKSGIKTLQDLLNILRQKFRNCTQPSKNIFFPMPQNALKEKRLNFSKVKKA